MTCVVGSSSRRSAIAAIARTRSTGSAGCCAEPRRACPSTAGPDFQIGLSLGDPAGELTAAWMVAQDLRLVYRRSADLADARRRLHDVLQRAVFSGVPELLRLARTLDGWTEELLAYFSTGGVSNGPTEAVNLLIEPVAQLSGGW